MRDKCYRPFNYGVSLEQNESLRIYCIFVMEGNLQTKDDALSSISTDLQQTSSNEGWSSHDKFSSCKNC